MGKNKKKFKAAASVGSQSTNTKKEAVLGAPKKGGGKSTFVGLGIAVAVVAVIAFVIFGGGTGSSAFSTVKAEAGMVKIPISDVNDGLAHYYTYNGSRPINFFVLRSSDGIIRAAFDACDVCFREKKGYHQEGDIMVCNNCGQRFPSVKVNEIKGGCNPAPLERNVQGDNLVVSTADIENGAFYF
jgi:uncharacterized membrane protein